MVKRISKRLYKCARNRDLMILLLQDACKGFVETMMTGYCSSCGEAEWFCEINLVPALVSNIQAVFFGAGRKRESYLKSVKNIRNADFEDAMDPLLLNKALWDVLQTVLSEEKVQSKMFQALSR